MKRLIPALVIGFVFSCSAGDPAVQCDLTGLSDQPASRFPAGRTFWLPKADCDQQWLVTSAPDDVTVVPGADGWSRFTPVVAGEYVLSLEGTEHTQWVTVVAADAAPFHNVNYYGSSTLAVVGDEIWAAGVTAPAVSRHSAADLSARGQIVVGGWPVALAHDAATGVVVVAQRGDDTLGFIDTATSRLTDAVWVGDEPANVVIHNGTAWVALAGQNAVARVEITERALAATVDAVFDPLGMAISGAGDRLFVASHRSGHPDRTPYQAKPAGDERDIAIINTTDNSLVGHILDVGTTINALRWDDGLGALMVSGLRNDTQASLSFVDQPNFWHEVRAISPQPGLVSVLASADLTRQDSSGGHAVTLHAAARDGDTLWVTAESSDLVIGLAADTLAETARFEVVGRPRHVVAHDGAIFAHGQQAFSITRAEAGVVTHTEATATDPRPAEVAAGQAYFTGAGRDYAQNWSCNSCHADGLTDGLIWNAGPFSDRIVARPFFWLEGTYPLGWAGYLSGVRNYALSVNTNVGIRPTTAEFEDLWSYMASLMPPPAANGWTERDGSLSAEGLAGKALYEGKGGCATCHATPLTTNRASFAEGITPGVSDVPALVGIYRHGAWLKFGDAFTLLDGVAAADDWLGGSLSGDERQSVARYISELTGRDFFVLDSAPRAGDVTAPIDRPIVLTFSQPVHPEGATAIVLSGPDGDIESTVTVDGRKVTLTATLKSATGYTITLPETLESWDERAVTGPTTLSFTTAAAPALTLSGEYIWTVEVPLANPFAGEFDTSQTIRTPVTIMATADGSGARLAVDYGSDLALSAAAVMNGAELISEPIPVPIGPSFGETTGMRGVGEDTDGDGSLDTASGTLTLSGPGFLVEDVTWQLDRRSATCEPSDNGVTVTRDGDAVVIDWGDEASLGLYVTTPGAAVPLGPGQVVTQGEAHWVLEVETFPVGFEGPVTYLTVPEAAVEATEKHGGPAGGADLPEGQCVTVSVITMSFKVLDATLVW